MRYLLTAWMILGGNFVEAQEAKKDKDIESVISIADEVFTNDLFAKETRSKRAMDYTRKIESALRDLGCDHVVIAPSNVHSSTPEKDNVFTVNSSNCKLQPNTKDKKDICEAPFEARGLPRRLGVDGYKVCLKSKPSNIPADSSAGKS